MSIRSLAYIVNVTFELLLIFDEALISSSMSVVVSVRVFFKKTFRGKKHCISALDVVTSILTF